MKIRKPPLSIRVIYWFTSIMFGLLTIILFATIIFNALLYTDFFGNDMQLHIQLPVKVDFLEIGNLHVNDQDINVQLVDATSQIHFIDTPKFITRKGGVAILFVVLFGCYLIWTFRKFIKNVKNNQTFTLNNIELLKRISYTLLIFWLFTVIYMRIAYYYIAKRLEFESVRITDDIPNYLGILFVALFIWVLAHIFSTGLKLQQEKDLTI